MEAIINQIKAKEWESAKEVLNSAGNIIRNGGTVIFPTETVYGLGANALDPRAAKRIYKAKGRPSDNPLIVHISNQEMLHEIATCIPKESQQLIDAYWPGPLTLIFYKKDIVPYETTGGMETVAVRMPDHPIAKAIIEAAGVPVAAPSANISGKPSITAGKHAIDEMAQRVDMIIISEDSDIGIESTVVDMTTEVPIVLRPGKISQQDVIRVISKDEDDFQRLWSQYLGMLHNKESNQSEPKSPGMRYTHYSPDAALYLLPKEALLQFVRVLSTGETIDGREPFLQNLRQELLQKSKNQIRILTKDSNLEEYGGYGISLGRNEEEIGKNLFRILREMDEQQIEIILCEDFAQEAMESEFLVAVMNRIRKAANNIND